MKKNNPVSQSLHSDTHSQTTTGSDTPAFKDRVDEALDLVEDGLHYGCGKNNLVFVATEEDNPNLDKCCGCYSHKDCPIEKTLKIYRKKARKALDQAYQKKYLAEGWIDGRALGRKRYWKVGSCSWCGKSLRRDHSKCETAKAAIKNGEGDG